MGRSSVVQEPTSGRKRRLRPGRLALVIAIVMAAGGVLAAGALVYKALRTLPNVQNLATQSASSQIYDVNNQYLTSIWGQTSVPVPLSEIPKNLQNAIIATEDHRFWTESGLDPLAILSAAWADLLHRSAVRGASTITEQLGKIHYLTDNGSLSYKVAEVLLGLEIAHTYTKPQILDMYLNQVYLGEGATGVGAASEIYFSKPVNKLNLAQCALLAGLPQAPSAYDPLVHLSLAKARQRIVLQNLVTYGYITQAQADAAFRTPLHLDQGSVSQSPYKDPWFVDAVVSFLLGKHFSMHELATGGLKIYTTIDPTVEQDAENAVASVMNRSFPLPASGTPEPEAAVVVMNPRDGDVLALVGGRRHSNILGFNRATSAYRQTGSAIKPLAEYPTAIMQGMTAATVVDDGPWLLRNGKPWPQNDNHKYLGRITLTDALAQSDNNVAVRLANMVGVNNAFDTATQKFGLPLVGSGPVNDRNLAMAIGGLTRGVTPLQMADAYATYANEGYRPTPILVRKVVAPDGQVLFSQSPHLTPELTAQQSYIMIKMMEAVIQYGTGVGAQIGRPEAGKTGTTSSGQDGWFIGFVPQLVTAVWEGNDSPGPQANVYGATYALPIWTDTMRAALAGVPVKDFPVPSGIVPVAVDTKSGLLPSPLTPPQDIQTFDFINGTQPTAQSDVWVQAEVDAQHPNELWSPACAPDLPETKVFLKRPTDIFIGPQYLLPADANLWVPTKSCTGPAGTPPPPTAGHSVNATITIAAVPGGGAPEISPTSITVAQGDAVTLTIQNNDIVSGYAFNFAYPGVTSPQTVSANSYLTITFTASQGGSFPFSITSETTNESTQGTFTVTASPGQGPGQGPGPGQGQGPGKGQGSASH